MTDDYQELNHVLLVDDDPILVSVISTYLSEGRAKSVHMASNGSEALSILYELSDAIDLILCDLNMPEVDGFQFLRRISASGFAGSVAIISGEDASVLRLAESLADTHQLNLIGALSKPICYPELDEILTESRKLKRDVAADPKSNITEKQLRSALVRKHIVPYYQPKLDARTGKIVGVEVLARWHCPDLGLIGPDWFIPLAEQTGLIDPLTEHIINIAFDDAQAWQEAGISLPTAINLSVLNLNNLELPDEIAGKLSKRGLAHSNYTFEITESQLLSKIAEPMEVLARLRIMGFDLAVDDFGTGYSNLEIVREFPFSELKIDRSFVYNAKHDDRARASLETCVDLGKKFNLRTVAEGVETMQDWNIVSALDVDHVQGFLIAEPMPAAKLNRWVGLFANHSEQMVRALKAG